MLLHTCYGEAPTVMAPQGLRDTHTELVARCVGRHPTDIPTDELHGIAPVTHPGAVAPFGLRGAAIDDSDKVSGDDDPVLAFLLGVFRYDALLCYFHS